MINVTILMMASLLNNPSVASDANADQATLKKGKEILRPLKKELKQTLISHMKKGPAEAITACNLRAGPIAKKLQTGRYTLGRTSSKLRNSNNKPEKWLGALLDIYSQSSGSKKMAPQIVKGEGFTGYVEPIYTGGMCLKCHGAKLSPGIASKLNELYPKDQATGYKAGEFRGLFWVKFK
jgi:hypothetical protein